MTLQKEFSLAEGQIDKLIAANKLNSDDYKILGMLDENNASRIIDGGIRIVRRTLETITKDYQIKQRQEKEIADFIEKMHLKIEKSVLEEDILVHAYGEYVNKYGIKEEITYDEAYQDFIRRAKEKLNDLEIQKMRVNNFRTRTAAQLRREWIPIIISAIALIVSIISLIWR